MDILVIGCGVSGLTTGVRLAEAGHSVTIWAANLPGQSNTGTSTTTAPSTITSEVAAAVWYPYKAYPQDRVNAWGATTYNVLHQLAAQEPSEAHGIILSTVMEVFPQPTADPWWLPAVAATFRHAYPDELPPGYTDGYVFQAPVADMSIYLGYLQRRFTGLGGAIVERTISGLDQALAECPIVVNCTGLGSRALLSDTLLYPSLGQVVRIRKQEAFQRVVLDDYGPNKVAYIVPRLHDVVLGGIDDEHNENLVPDPEVTASILRRCGNLVAQISHIQPEDVLSVVCGLRPARSEVRLELEEISAGRWVVHNYGHGGAGVTLSWGCAAEVVDLIGGVR
ncbi:MAG: FAD-binding oxidoreductase [Chloroflexi bacterium]|nr:MAG: FAD-binding oxidoreductase [Chloroflexota bacterium]